MPLVRARGLPPCHGLLHLEQECGRSDPSNSDRGGPILFDLQTSPSRRKADESPWCCLGRVEYYGITLKLQKGMGSRETLRLKGLERSPPPSQRVSHGKEAERVSVVGPVMDVRTVRLLSRRLHHENKRNSLPSGGYDFVKAVESAFLNVPGVPFL